MFIRNKEQGDKKLRDGKEGNSDVGYNLQEIENRVDNEQSRWIKFSVVQLN